jgi:hypothetical protein
MAETESTSDGKVISGPPPKLDLRKEGLLKGTQPAPPQATTVAPKTPVPSAQPSGAPVLHQPPAAAAKPQGPFIKLGFTGETETAKPVAKTTGSPQAAGHGVRTPKVGPAALKRPTFSSPLKPSAAAAPFTPHPTAAATHPASAGVLKSAAKNETSKVPLEMATSTPASVAATEDLSRAATAGTENNASDEKKLTTVIDEKRLTSRISLEAVLMPEEAGAATPAAGDSGPKTIRLKRPGEGTTVKVISRPKLSKPDDDGTSAAALSRTARLEEPAEEEEGGETPTKRKTIRIKRPTQTPSAAGTGVRSEVSREPMQFVVEDEPSWIFPFVTIAAVLVVCVVIYVLLAQAFGPNISLTELSYGAPGMNLAWPGKIMMMQ